MEELRALGWEMFNQVGIRTLIMIVISILAAVYLFAKMWLSAKSSERNFNALMELYNNQIEEGREFRREAREREEAAKKETREREEAARNREEAARKEAHERDEAARNRDEAARKEAREREEAARKREEAARKEARERDEAARKREETARKEARERDEAWQKRHDALVKELHEKEVALRKEIDERDEAWQKRHDALVKELHEKEVALRKEFREQDEAWQKRHDALRKELHEKEDAQRKEFSERTVALLEDLAVLKDVHALLATLVPEREASPDKAREETVRQLDFGAGRRISPNSEEGEGKLLSGGQPGEQVNEPKQRLPGSGKLAGRRTGPGKGARLPAKRAG